jgi:hypothetical protein
MTDCAATRQMTECCSPRDDSPLEKNLSDDRQCSDEADDECCSPIDDSPLEKIVTVTPIMKRDMLKNASREVLTIRQAKR